MTEIPLFNEKSDLFDWLIENKSLLMAQKKASIKYADAVSAKYFFIADGPTKGIEIKSEIVPATATKIKVRSIINTTKLFDSHGDVHIDQLWNKSLKDTKDNYLVKQHDFSFDGTISDNVHAFVKQMSWVELGYPQYDGMTQALVYDSIIDKAESPFMFEKYRTGKVRQHSVGMRYIKIELAVNDERYDKEKAVWDKYIGIVANREDAEAQGNFWAVTEAKNIEGSAVMRGSNFVTPTQSVSQTKNIEPVLSTQNSAAKSTLVKQELQNLLKKLQ